MYDVHVDIVAVAPGTRTRRSTRTAATTFPITPSMTIVNRVRSDTLSWESMLMSIDALGPQNASAMITAAVSPRPRNDVAKRTIPRIARAIATPVWTMDIPQTL